MGLGKGQEERRSCHRSRHQDVYPRRETSGVPGWRQIHHRQSRRTSDLLHCRARAAVKKERRRASGQNCDAGHYWNSFARLIVKRFERISLVRDEVLPCFGLLLNELTSDKTNLRTPAPLVAATHPARRCL